MSAEIDRLRTALTAIREEHEDIPALVAFIDRTLNSNPREPSESVSEVTEAIEWLREWGEAGFPKRADGSFPTDYLTAMRTLTGITVEQVSTRPFEAALSPGVEAC